MAVAAAVDTVGVPADIDLVPVLAEDVVVVVAAPAVAVQEPALCCAAVDLELTAVMGFVPIVSWQHQPHPSLLARSGEGASWVALG